MQERTATKLLIMFLHWFMLVFDLGGLLYLYFTPHDVFGWHYVYLTVWGLTVQSIYFAWALLVDLIHFFREVDIMYKHMSPEDLHKEIYSSVDKFSTINVAAPSHRTRLEEHKDRLFTLVFPLATLIGIVFWTMIWPIPEARKELLAAPGGFFLTFQQHGTTLIFVWLELFLVQHSYRRKRHEIAILLSFAAVYLTWNIITYFVNLPALGPEKAWPYPFQVLLAQNLAIGIPVYAGLFLLAVGLYMLGRLINYYFWRWRWRRRSYEFQI